ncbi:hypothetical protein P2318_32210 [Myxococcaceae bacterium GXIMD 01537]
MALRLQLAPRAVNALTHCPASVRERVQHELGALAAVPPARLARPPSSGVAETVVLGSGFCVHYEMDPAHGLLCLLDVMAPPPSPRPA